MGRRKANRKQQPRACTAEELKILDEGNRRLLIRDGDLCTCNRQPPHALSLPGWSPLYDPGCFMHGTSVK